MKMKTPSVSPWALLAWTLTVVATSFREGGGGAVVAQTPPPPNICFVVYQMADNNLDPFIRDDNVEIIQSCATSEPNFFTWVYFDGFTSDPLESVWERDGSAPQRGTEYGGGSQYLTYRHDLAKMVSDVALQGERDGDDPQTLYDFLTHAFQDCVGRGADEYMLSLSSHGGGFHGFGDNPLRRRRGRLLRRRTGGEESSGEEGRDLVQDNVDIAGAIESALRDVDGAPDELDVLGFDACLMMSVSALFEYEGVAKYFLASEATEPGHGWAYRELCKTDSALDVAIDIYENFLSRKQGIWGHQSPKTLALVDTSKFEAFRESLEALAGELKSAIEADDDPEFFALLQRSRAGAVSFESVLDNPGADQKAALDVGSFLDTFDDLCSPKARSSLDAAKKAYGDMFVRRGNGPGTPQATGMHVMWPPKKAYKANPDYFDGWLFDSPAVTRTAPNFFDMVRTFLLASSPTSRANVGGNCFKSAQSDVEPTREGQLLLNPTLSSNGGIVTVRSDLVTSTDEVIVNYGIDGTEWLFLPERRRQWRELELTEVEPASGITPPRATEKKMPVVSPSTRRALSSARSSAHQATRRDVEEGHLFVYGGQVEGSYSGPAFTASGARGFYFLADSDNLTPVFLYTSPSEGDEKSAEIPVMYFPRGVDITSDDLSYETTLEEGVEMGGLYGSLTFGMDAAGTKLTTGFALMTNDAPTPNSTISETPPSAGGRIVPIIKVDGAADGMTYSDILGGVDQTVIDWNEDRDFSLMVMSPERALLNFGLNHSTAVVDMFAFDYDKIDLDNLVLGEGFDYHSFEVEIDASEASLRRSGARLLVSLTLTALIGTSLLF